jgi:Recombination endonuclease VII
VSRTDYNKEYYATESGKAKVRAGVAKYLATEKGKRTQFNQRLRKHGITADDYDHLLYQQGGGCALCGAVKSKHGSRLAVDHCHTTGHIRGLLCFNCNRKLGSLEADPAWIARAMVYTNRN